MSDSEFSKLVDLLNQKLTYYYQKYNLDYVKKDTNTDIDIDAETSLEACKNNEVHENCDCDNIEITDISTLSKRAINVLLRNGIVTVGELKAFVQTNDLNDLKSLGKKTYSEIYALLEKHYYFHQL